MLVKTDHFVLSCQDESIKKVEMKGRANVDKSRDVDEEISSHLRWLPLFPKWFGMIVEDVKFPTGHNLNTVAFTQRPMRRFYCILIEHVKMFWRLTLLNVSWRV